MSENPAEPAEPSTSVTDSPGWGDVVVAAVLALAIGVGAGFVLAGYAAQDERAACQRVADATLQSQSGSDVSASTDDVQQCLETQD